MRERVTRCIVIINRPTRISEHSNQGEGHKYSATDGDGQVKAPDLFGASGKCTSHTEDYTREQGECQGIEPSGGEKDISDR